MAADARLRVLVEELIGRPISRPSAPSDDTGLLTSDEVNTIQAFWDRVTALRSGGAHPTPDCIGRHGRVRIDSFLRQQGWDDIAIKRFHRNAYRFFDELRVRDDAPKLFRGLPAFFPMLPTAMDGSESRESGPRPSRGRRMDHEEH